MTINSPIYAREPVLNSQGTSNESRLYYKTCVPMIMVIASKSAIAN